MLVCESGLLNLFLTSPSAVLKPFWYKSVNPVRAAIFLLHSAEPAEPCQGFSPCVFQRWYVFGSRWTANLETRAVQCGRFGPPQRSEDDPSWAALEVIDVVQALLAVPVLCMNETIRQKTGGVCGYCTYGESSTTVSESYLLGSNGCDIDCVAVSEIHAQQSQLD